MTYRTYVGIDPGASGGIAVIRPNAMVTVYPMPGTEEEIWSLVDGIVAEAYKTGSGSLERPLVQAVIEQVGGFIRGETAHGSDNVGAAASMFKFGQSYGGLRMALVSAGLREGRDWSAVIPRTWQKGVGISPRDSKGGETGPQFKRRLRETAQSLFPGTSVTLKTCDALLIAEHARREGRGVFR